MDRYSQSRLLTFISGKNADVETTDGEHYKGEIRNLDDEGYVTLLTPDGDLIMIPKGSVRRIKVEKVMSLEESVEAERPYPPHE